MSGEVIAMPVRYRVVSTPFGGAFRCQIGNGCQIGNRLPNSMSRGGQYGCQNSTGAKTASVDREVDGRTKRGRIDPMYQLNSGSWGATPLGAQSHMGVTHRHAPSLSSDDSQVAERTYTTRHGNTRVMPRSNSGSFRMARHPVTHKGVTKNRQWEDIADEARL